MSETIAWVIIVCGLMGSLIMLLLRAGAVDAFSAALAAKAKSSKSALMYTWLLGIIVFIDDYLNALAVGAAMRKVTDQFRSFTRKTCLRRRLDGRTHLRAGADFDLGRLLREAYFRNPDLQNRVKAWPCTSAPFPT